MNFNILFASFAQPLKRVAMLLTFFLVSWYFLYNSFKFFKKISPRITSPLVCLNWHNFLLLPHCPNCFLMLRAYPRTVVVACNNRSMPNHTTDVMASTAWHNDIAHKVCHGMYTMKFHTKYVMACTERYWMSSMS